MTDMEYEEPTIDEDIASIIRWANDEANRLTDISHLDGIYDYKFYDKNSNRYICIPPIIVAEFKNKDTSETCKMFIELPAAVRKALIKDEMTFSDEMAFSINVAQFQLHCQLACFLANYAKEMLAQHHELAV